MNMPDDTFDRRLGFLRNPKIALRRRLVESVVLQVDITWAFWQEIVASGDAHTSTEHTCHRFQRVMEMRYLLLEQEEQTPTHFPDDGIKMVVAGIAR